MADELDAEYNAAVANGHIMKARRIGRQIAARERNGVKPLWTGCSCPCHEYCHTCGNPFIKGLPHVNCADTGKTLVAYGWTDGD